MDELLEDVLAAQEGEPEATPRRTRGLALELALAFLFAVPAFYFSPMWQTWMQYTAVSFPMASFVPAVCATLASVLVGRVLVKSVIAQARLGEVGQGIPATLALVLGLIHGYVLLFTQPIGNLKDTDFFWQVAGAALFLLLSVWFSRARAVSLEIEENYGASTSSVIGVYVLVMTAIGLVMTIAGDIPASVAILCAISVTAAVANAPWARATAIIAAERVGVFVLKREAFNSLRAARLVLIELTGIITSGERRFTEVRLTRRGGMESDDELLAVLAGLEAGSKDAIARAVNEEIERRGIEPIEVKDVMAVPGIGVSGRLAEYRVSAGGPALLTRQKIEIDPLDLFAADALNTSGNTVIYVVRNDVLLGFVALAEHVRPSAATAVDLLHDLGRTVGFISSEAYGVVRSIANRLEVEEVFAEVLPHDKAKVVEQVQAKYGPVALAAFPETDSTALSAAAIGIAMVDEDKEEKVDSENTAMVLDSTDPADVASVVRLDAIAQRRERAAGAAILVFNVVGVLLLGYLASAVVSAMAAFLVLALTGFNAWLVNRSIR